VYGSVTGPLNDLPHDQVDSSEMWIVDNTFLYLMQRHRAYGVEATFIIALYKSTVFQSCSHSKSDRPWISRRLNKTCQIARLPGLAQYFENFERLLGREAYVSSHNVVS
tara:strand:+ start:65 stop:391 length:327 start_codon:yes stop_codon:yes gene_type:complete